MTGEDIRYSYSPESYAYADCIAFAELVRSDPTVTAFTPIQIGMIRFTAGEFLMQPAWVWSRALRYDREHHA